MNDLETLRIQVLALPPSERAKLMEDILSSFDPEERESVDRAWAAEAEDRLRAFEEGNMEAYTIEEVRARIRNG